MATPLPPLTAQLKLIQGSVTWFKIILSSLVGFRGRTDWY